MRIRIRKRIGSKRKSKRRIVHDARERALEAVAG
jgi:hypothetical protein